MSDARDRATAALGQAIELTNMAYTHAQQGRPKMALSALGVPEDKLAEARKALGQVVEGKA